MPTAAVRLRRLTLAVAAGLAAAACNNSVTEAGPDVEIQRVRLTITPPAGGTPTVVEVTENSQGAAPVALRVGTSSVRAEPLDDDGRVVDEASEFELQMADLPAGMTLRRNGTLTAQLEATAPVTTPATVSAIMFHRAENHEDYRARFRVTVAP